MQRQIKFRGKRVDTEQWVYGDLVHNAFDGTSSVMEVGIVPNNYYPYGVIPETVGQYTGLNDKNGNEIFEGDIIKSGLGEIFFDVKFAQFRIRWHEKTWEYIRGNNQSYQNGEALFFNHEISFEIIGNIHDNPSLIKQ